MDLHVFPISIPSPTSLSTRFLWVFPVHQVRALVSCIQPGLVICFTLDNIHVSMLFSLSIPLLFYQVARLLWSFLPSSSILDCTIHHFIYYLTSIHKILTSIYPSFQVTCKFPCLQSQQTISPPS